MSSTAEEMLNSLTEEEIAAYTANPEERHIIVDETRKITVPDELKRIAVQYDHNIETVTFDCIRYWDGHDMSTMHVYINYLLANKALGCYMSEDVTVDPNDENIIHFTWTISRHVTQAIGPVTFLVCIKRVDEEGNEVNHWNSELNKEMFVNQGLECGEPISEDYPDIIEQILLKLESQDKYPAWRRWTDASGNYTDESGIPYGVKLMDESNNASGSWSIAGGYNTTASGACSASLGNTTTASGLNSVAFGLHSYAGGDSSVAFGNYTQANGHRSVAFGENTKAIVDNQLVIGRYNVPDSNKNAFIIGNGTTDALKNALTVDWDGNLGLSGGIINLNSGNSVSGENGLHGMMAIGAGNTASAYYSAAIGVSNTVSGQYSVAMCAGNSVSGVKSVAMGQNNTVINDNSVAMGQSNTVNSSNSVAIGHNNTASGGTSVAMGYSNTASNYFSVAIGLRNTASGDTSIAMGQSNNASGVDSVSIGTGLIAAGDTQTALGRYNVDETEFDMRNLFVLGNGTDANNRSNAMAVDVAGNLNMNRDVVANAFGDSPISLVELSNRIGVVEEKLAKLVTPEGSV